MLTVVLAVLTTGLAVAVGVFYSLWREASQIAADQARLIRHQLERIDGYRAELDALSIGGPLAAARAVLTPDDPALLPAEVEQWLREGAN